VKPVLIQDKLELAAFLGKYPQFNFYHLGDLDDFFWPHTSWYAYKQGNEIFAVTLFYTGINPPVLLAIYNHNLPQMRELVIAVQPELPPKFYSHLSPELDTVFGIITSLLIVASITKWYWRMLPSWMMWILRA
jgi:hypothetical protein